MTRRLAAILAADIVGYSALMGADQEGTLMALRQLRTELFGPAVAGHRGKVVKSMGDGWLVEFGSAVDAVTCAVQVQDRLTGHEVIRLRIGIHLGDVVHEDEDVFGDGVNVAARLEALAEPGAVLVSDAVYGSLDGALRPAFVDRGKQRLKNIDRPVRVWGRAAKGAPAPDEPGALQGHWRPTIAVLPFANLAGNPDEDYFADGLTEDLITALTHWRSFPVIARNSTFTYKGQAVNVPEAARQLGAAYVVEGSVRRAGRRVRVTAQLIDGATGHHVWAERYDRDLADIFEVQDELVRRISAVLAPEVGRAELKRTSVRRPDALGAWEHYLRGNAALERQTPEAMHEARRQFERAIEIDPGYSDAHTGLALSYLLLDRLDPNRDRDAIVRAAMAASQRAIELDPDSSHAHFALSTVYILRNEHDLSLAEARLAVELNPNDPLVLHALGNKSDLAGDPDGIARMEVAQRLNPRDPIMTGWLGFLARAHINTGDYEKAVAKAQEAIARRPDYAHARLLLAIALAHLGRLEEAAVAIDDCEPISPGYTAQRLDWTPYSDPSRNRHLRDGLSARPRSRRNARGETMTRRLAAILAADIVGYSALMGADQEGTLAALRQLRTELFGPAVAGHRGKVVKSMGDGWLVEFGSAVDAVTCAMQVQDRLRGHEVIRLRIGIHLGDIVHEDEDVFGDGVNIAARLEALAEQGAVAISDAVYGSLDGTLRPSFDDLGPQELKNIPRPVQVWSRGGGTATSTDPAAVRPPSAQPGFPQLAVRPILTSDDRAEVRELASALTADFASFLGGARWLNSTVQEKPPPTANVLEATLRSRGDRLRLDVRLSTSDGTQLWTGKYDGSLADSFDWQDQVGAEIAGETLEALLDHERARLAGKSLNEMSAEECNISGMMSVALIDWEAMAKALEYQAAAVEKDPSFAEACSDAIVYYISASSVGYSDLVELYGERFGQWMAAAGDHVKASPMIELALGIGQFRRAGDVTALRRAIRAALRRAPFTTEVVLFSGWGYAWMGEPEPAIECFSQGAQAFRFSPFAVAARAGMAFALLQAGRDEEAIREAQMGVEVTTEFSTLHRVIASAAAHLGWIEEAEAALRENERINPGDTIQKGWKRNAFADTPGTRRYYEGLRLAGMPEGEP